MPDTASKPAATKDFVESTIIMIAEIVRLLVELPNEVSLKPFSLPDATLLVLSVDPSDLWSVIGKQGRTAQSLRVILKTLTLKTGHRFVLDIQPNPDTSA
jgi:uncharacterized protein